MTDQKHSHYKKDVSKLDMIDVYRVLSLWEVTDPCIQHAVKKLLVAGGRGAKDFDKDIQEAIDSLQRLQAMRKEDTPSATVGTKEDTFRVGIDSEGRVIGKVVAPWDKNFSFDSVEQRLSKVESECRSLRAAFEGNCRRISNLEDDNEKLYKAINMNFPR